MTIVIFILITSYGGLVLFLHLGWLKAIARIRRAENDCVQFISIVVPVRNEALNIGLLLDDLVAQKYPVDSFEIIVVDDHSEDNTMSIVSEKGNTSVVQLNVVVNEGRGKKSAITTGVNVAQGGVIVTTDADCRVGSNWLKSIHDIFSDNTIKLVFGAVKIQIDNSFFSKVQAIEFSSLIGSGAATMAHRVPTMCNGANLAFQKDTFVEVGGYEGNSHVASGDDEFLLKKIVKRYPDGIRFNNSQEGIVTTKPQSTLFEFILQRLRWAGKWKFNSDFKSKLLALYIFLFHLSVLMLPILVTFGYFRLSFAIIFLLIKALLEYSFLRFVASWLKVQWSWSTFIFLQIVYSPYVVAVGLVSNFVKPSWRGRK